jgi:hypothetical protein
MHLIGRLRWQSPLVGSFVAAAVAMVPAAPADARVLSTCTYDALAAEVATGGTIVLDCDATIGFEVPLSIPRGTAVTLSAAGSDVTLDGQARTRLFEVSGALTLVDLRLTRGQVVGAAGDRGRDRDYIEPGVASQGQTDGACDAYTGEIKWGADPGEDGPAGADGGRGGDGAAAAGGAVLVTDTGRLTLVGGRVSNSVARGGAGGGGGLGSTGWTGGKGAWGISNFTPDPDTYCQAPPGDGGAGGDGGRGGDGGTGGSAMGGAVANFGTTVVDGTLFVENLAQGGPGASGAPGAAGGNGGDGGSAFIGDDRAQSLHGASGGDGGDAGPVGRPGAGGAAQGGAIGGPGRLTLLNVRFVGNRAGGSHPGTGATPLGYGGYGGLGGLTVPDHCCAERQTGPDGNPGHAASPPVENDGGDGAGGAVNLTGPDALIQSVNFERNTARGAEGGSGWAGGNGGDAFGGAFFTQLTAATALNSVSGNLVLAGAAGEPNGTRGLAAGPNRFGPATPAAPLSIDPQPATVKSTTSLPFSLAFTASRGKAPYVFSFFGLPTGLHADTSGHLTGSPSRAGVYETHLLARDTSVTRRYGAHSWRIEVAPRVSKLTPTHGRPGTSVTITGQGFWAPGRGQNTVSFGSVPAASVTYFGAQKLTAVVPAGLTTGKAVPVYVTSGGVRGTGPSFTAD